MEKQTAACQLAVPAKRLVLRRLQLECTELIVYYTPHDLV